MINVEIIYGSISVQQTGVDINRFYEILCQNKKKEGKNRCDVTRCGFLFFFFLVWQNSNSSKPFGSTFL